MIEFASTNVKVTSFFHLQLASVAFLKCKIWTTFAHNNVFTRKVDDLILYLYVSRCSGVGRAQWANQRLSWRGHMTAINQSETS